MSGTTLHATDRYSLYMVGRLHGPLVLVIIELQLHSRLCIVEEAECVRRALREARETELWIGIDGGRRIKYVLQVTPFEGRSRIRAWYETTREVERLKISEARKDGELGRVITDGAILRVLAAHDRYWKESIKTLEAIEDGGDKEDFETFYDILERSAMRLQVVIALTYLNRDRRDREQFARARRLDDYPQSPCYEADRGRGDSRGRWETDQGRRDGYRVDRYERSDRDDYRDDRYERSDRDGYRNNRYERSDQYGYRDDRYERSDRDGYRGGRYERGDRDWERRDESRGRFKRGGDAREQRDESWGWYNRGDRRDESRGRYDSGDRRNDSRGRYEQGGSGGDRRNDSRGRNERGGYDVSSEPYPKSPDPKAARSSISRSADERPSTPRNSCVYCRGEDHIKRDCPDLKRAIDEGLVMLDDRKYVKWADDLGDVSMFPSMKENVEARRVKPSKEKESVRSQSIKITFEGDMATTPIRVAATKSARGSTSKKTDTDYVMAKKDGQWVDEEEVILSSRKRGVKKFLMKKKAEPLRLLLRKTEKFYWDCSQELAMQELKDEFKEGGRVLGVPYFDDEAGRPFIVVTDAGPCSVGGLLSQKDAEGKERPLTFESRTLNTAERNYSQFKKEV
ncbi:hypothetical protein CBR_g23920 [Chara braunii]|uniref:Reverse transcriptase/retrotransposon-derived protein RNase H-like domain-containing protein n=1 Tax=Chara braunii TaxID=69332 RepID=A0A388L5F2_CHABU|nr:hypothetical protein CBR_g23920 [Chara braunii]|eukprot:GBG77472.1 hypothetical protein CBR_g23920 [Chara braunii]